MWLARTTRPDLIHSVARVARCVDRWGPGAQKALGRIVAYIELHPRSYLRYPYEEHSKHNEPLGLQVFADADFASDRRDRKSTSGLAAFVTSGQARYLVHWESNKQHVVSTSSAEAEVVALARAVKFTLSAANMFVGLNVKTRVLTDSEAGYKAVQKGFWAKLAHLRRMHAVSVAWLSDVVKNGYVSLEWVSGEKNAADVFTKFMERKEFEAKLRLLDVELGSLRSVSSLRPSGMGGGGQGAQVPSLAPPWVACGDPQMD